MGFNPLLQPYTFNNVWTHDPAADETFTLFRFPAVGQVLGSYATNTATQIAGAGTSLAMFLVHASSAATPAILGTLGSWSTGPWGVDVPRAMTITAYGSTAFFGAGEWALLKYDETATGTWTEMGFQVDYVLGRTQGATPSAGTGPA